MKASISSLKNNLSAAIESTIHHSFKIITSSNDTNISEMSGFISKSNITTESNSISFSNCSLVFGIYGNSQKLITSNETHLTFAISDLIISEGLSFNLSQKPRFKKIQELAMKVTKTSITPNINLTSKDLLDVIHEKNMKRNL